MNAIWIVKIQIEIMTIMLENRKMDRLELMTEKMERGSRLLIRMYHNVTRKKSKLHLRISLFDVPSQNILICMKKMQVAIALNSTLGTFLMTGAILRATLKHACTIWADDGQGDNRTARMT